MRKFTLNEDGKDVDYEVRMPTAVQRREGRRLYNKTLAECLKDGCILRAQVEDFAIKQGLWSEEKQAKVKALREELSSKARILEEGGIELEEAKKVAESMREIRSDLMELNFKLNEVATLSAEVQAENEEINYLISVCVFKAGKPYFKSLDDYLQKVGEDPVATVASLQFQYMWYGMDNNVSDSYIENQFLKEFGFEKDEEPEQKERKPFLKDGKPVNGS